MPGSVVDAIVSLPAIAFLFGTHAAPWVFVFPELDNKPNKAYRKVFDKLKANIPLFSDTYIFGTTEDYIPYYAFRVYSPDYLEFKGESEHHRYLTINGKSSRISVDNVDKALAIAIHNGSFGNFTKYAYNGYESLNPIAAGLFKLFIQTINEFDSITIPITLQFIAKNHKLKIGLTEITDGFQSVFYWNKKHGYPPNLKYSGSDYNIYGMGLKIKIDYEIFNDYGSTVSIGLPSGSLSKIWQYSIYKEIIDAGTYLTLNWNGISTSPSIKKNRVSDAVIEKIKKEYYSTEADRIIGALDKDNMKKLMYVRLFAEGILREMLSWFDNTILWGLDNPDNPQVDEFYLANSLEIYKAPDKYIDNILSTIKDVQQKRAMQSKYDMFTSIEANISTLVFDLYKETAEKIEAGVSSAIESSEEIDNVINNLSKREKEYWVKVQKDQEEAKEKWENFQHIKKKINDTILVKNSLSEQLKQLDESITTVKVASTQTKENKVF